MQPEVESPIQTPDIYDALSIALGEFVRRVEAHQVSDEDLISAICQLSSGS